MSASYLDPQPVCEDGDGDGDLDCHYKFGSRPSMSAPHVAGAAALVLAAGCLAMTTAYGVANELREQLAATAVDLGTSGRDRSTGSASTTPRGQRWWRGGTAPRGHHLAADPYVVRKVWYVDLAWSGANGSEVLCTGTASSSRPPTIMVLRRPHRPGGRRAYVYRICDRMGVRARRRCRPPSDARH